jgi:transcriptional regulator with XRE-family HTH domain
MKNLPHNLLTIRKDVLGISRKEFADFIGAFSEYSLQNYEDGKIIPKPGYIKQIAQKVGISETDLLNKKLTKNDIPVIVVTQPQAENPDLMKVIEVLTKQLEHQQVVIEYLTAQLKKP